MTILNTFKRIATKSAVQAIRCSTMITVSIFASTRIIGAGAASLGQAVFNGMPRLFAKFCLIILIEKKYH